MHTTCNVSKAVFIYITIFLYVILYRLVGGYQHSKGIYCLHSQGLNEKCEDAAIKMVTNTHGTGRGDVVIVTITEPANCSTQSCYVIPSVMYSCMFAESLATVNKIGMGIMLWMTHCL